MKMLVTYNTFCYVNSIITLIALQPIVLWLIYTYGTNNNSLSHIELLEPTLAKLI